MPDKDSSKKKQIIYIAIIVVMVASTVFMLIRRAQDTGETDLLVGNTQGTVSEEDALAAAGIVDDKSLDSILDSLVRYGNWPVQEGPISGRSNPFIPIQ